MFFKKEQKTNTNTKELKKIEELNALLNKYRHLVNECLATMETEVESKEYEYNDIIKYMDDEKSNNEIVKDILRIYYEKPWLAGETKSLNAKSKELFNEYCKLGVPVVVVYDV